MSSGAPQAGGQVGCRGRLRLPTGWRTNIGAWAGDAGRSRRRFSLGPRGTCSPSWSPITSPFPCARFAGVLFAVCLSPCLGVSEIFPDVCANSAEVLPSPGACSQPRGRASPQTAVSVKTQKTKPGVRQMGGGWGLPPPDAA